MVSSFKLSELWQRIGFRVVVVCMGKNEQLAGSKEQLGKASIEQVSGTLEIHRVPDFFIPDPWNYGIAFGFSGYAVKLVKSIKPDIVVVNKLLFWSSLSTIALRLRGVRVIQITDALVGMTWWPRGFIPKVCAAIYAWTLGWLELLCAERVVFFHPQSEKLLKRLGIAKKSQVIPTGIDKEKYERDVTFTGLQSDIPGILSKTDIFVLPSHSEGLSNALMEAMASSCACIASDVGGNRFLIQNGISGFLFPAGDREALRSHIQRLIEDPIKRQSMGMAARERIEKLFSWDIVGEQYDQLFQKFITQK